MVCSLRIGDRITIIETKQGSVRAVHKLLSFLKMLHRAEDHISDAQEAHIAQPVQSAEPAHETGEI